MSQRSLRAACSMASTSPGSLSTPQLIEQIKLLKGAPFLIINLVPAYGPPSGPER